MFRKLAWSCLFWLFFCYGAHAQSFFPPVDYGFGFSLPPVTTMPQAVPQRIVGALPPARYCQTSDLHCIEVSCGERVLRLYQRGVGQVQYTVVTPASCRYTDGRVLRIEVNPSWYPTANIRAKYPELPTEVPPGDPRNAMGDAKFTLTANFGEAVRLHGTAKYGWTHYATETFGCVRLLNDNLPHNGKPDGIMELIAWLDGDPLRLRANPGAKAVREGIRVVRY